MDAPTLSTAHQPKFKGPPRPNFVTVYEGIECDWLIDADGIELLSNVNLSDDDYQKAEDAAWEEYHSDDWVCCDE